MKIPDLNKMTKKDVIPFYVRLVRGNYGQNQIVKINKSIIKKWSLSGLEDIKKQAWKYIEQEEEMQNNNNIKRL